MVGFEVFAMALEMSQQREVGPGGFIQGGAKWPLRNGWPVPRGQHLGAAVAVL